MKSQASVHGGEIAVSDLKELNLELGSTSSSETNKLEMKLNDELNVFDFFLENNFKKALRNDVSSMKLTSNETIARSKEKEEKINNSIEDPIENLNKSKAKRPTSVTLANIIFGSKIKKGIKYKNLRVLFDSGASESLIDEGYCLNKHRSNKKFETMNGAFSTKYESIVHFTLPEFSEMKVVNWKFTVANAKALGYDMVIGRDIMNGLGIDIVFSDQQVTWEGGKIPMREFRHVRKKYFSDHELKAVIQGLQEPRATREATARISKILDAKYKKANLEEIATKANHLSKNEKKLLLKLLKKYEKIFDGTLGEWKTEPVEFELKEGAKPHSQRFYPMPHIYKETFKKEIKRLVRLGVLEKVNESEWGSPTFIIPKKDNTVRVISDFRRLNTKIKRKPYPLPRISDTLQNMDGFTYASALDLNMGYYHIVLSPEAADMCTIVTEFGKFRYKRLPMGVAGSPDIFQAKINELLGDIDGIKAYIDDVLAIGKGSFEQHLQQLEEVFRRCEKHNLKLNAEKCSFAVSEIEYLGYIITKEGIKPDPKKVAAIQNMTRPTTVTEVRRLVGMVQYYRDLWEKRSHVLQPFTDLSGGKKGAKIKWTEELEEAFAKVKQMVCKETLLAYPDWSLPFDIHTDASDYQLGAVISQRGKPIAFFSRKLNSAQKNYTTTEKELLSIVECVKEFRNILYGYPITVYSDHKNLVHAATMSQSQRVMRWRLILEEFGPDIKHIKGEENIVADAISRLPTANQDQEEHCTEASGLTKNVILGEHLALEDEEEFPLNLPLVQRAQNKELKQTNSKLKQIINDKKSGYTKSQVDGLELITFKGKIYVPRVLRRKTLEWYHYYLNHPGGDRLYKTLSHVCYWKGMASQSAAFCKKCKICQAHKPRRLNYGHLPPKNVGDLVPWDTVHTDLIGPYSITSKQMQTDGKIIEQELQLTCMTMIDPVTGWFEIVEVPNFIVQDVNSKTFRESIDKTSARISRLFDQTWLSRYPRPKTVIFDNGSEFKKNFVPLLKDWSIKPKCTTIKNPQANSPVERIHQVLRHMFLTKNLREQVLDSLDPFGSILSSVAWAVRASHNSATNATPAQLVFGRDMLFNITTLADWKKLSSQKQDSVDKANLRENQKRTDYDYEVGQKVYIKQDGVHRKLERPKTGPFEITDVYTNGTVRIQRGHVNERINIRRLEPHFE